MTDAHGATSTADADHHASHGTNDAPVAVADVGADVTRPATRQRAFAGDRGRGNVLTNDTDVDAGDSQAVARPHGLAGNVATAVPAPTAR